MKLKSLVLTFAAVLALGNVAMAQDSTLKIGIAQETSSLYPNWLVSTPNQQIATHIFEPLVRMDVNNIPQPALAESWQAINDTTWEFKLRQGVTFHDGSPFTADNVIATFDHAKTVEGTGSTSGAYIRDHAYEKVDDYTVRITTKAPRPLFPAEMSVLYIYKAAASPDDFNSGKAAIGTGPYKLAEWTQGSHLILTRNDAYWGEKPEWQTVEFRPITSDPTRIAALLNGDVDVIDRVATADVNRLKETDGVTVVSRAGERVVYLQPDVSRDISPYVTGLGGERGTPEFSISLDGFGTATGETMSQHWMLLHQTNRERSLGHANYGRYTNIRIDSLLDEAMLTIDSAQREKMLHEISRMYMEDVALIPLHWQMNVWAMRDDLSLDPSLMEVTHAMRIKRKAN